MKLEQHLNKKKNIIYLIDSLGMGGAEKLTASILENLSNEFLPRVCVFKLRDGNPMAEQIMSLGIPVDFLPIPYIRDITALPRLVKYLKSVDADLIHGQLEIGAVFGCIAAKVLGIPSVVTLHTMPSQIMNIKSKLHQNLEYFSLRYFCDVVISVSEEARKFYMDIGDFDQSKLKTIYNGVDLSLFNKIDSESRFAIMKEFELPLDAKIIITVAVLRQPKGIQYMIKALSGVLLKFPNTYYLVVGDGEYEEKLKKEAIIEGVSKHVIFSGRRNNVTDFLNVSNLFVLPTLTEALPTVLAEAMASSLPVVASAVGGIPEMVIDGENGYLVSPGDVHTLTGAVIRILEDDNKSYEMGKIGRSIVEQKFSIKTQVKQLQNLYHDLLMKNK